MDTVCSRCKFSCNGEFLSEKLCVDCYWEEDSLRKLRARNTKEWVFSRAYSVAKQLMNKTHEESIQIAQDTVNKRFPN